MVWCGCVWCHHVQTSDTEAVLRQRLAAKPVVRPCLAERIFPTTPGRARYQYHRPVDHGQGIEGYRGGGGGSHGRTG